MISETKSTKTMTCEDCPSICLNLYPHISDTTAGTVVSEILGTRTSRIQSVLPRHERYRLVTTVNFRVTVIREQRKSRVANYFRYDNLSLLIRSTSSKPVSGQLPDCRQYGSCRVGARNENAMGRSLEIVARNHHNEVYFWPGSWAARAAPCTALRRPGALASTVSNSFSARPG
jgi:hypothetical protein